MSAPIDVLRFDVAPEPGVLSADVTVLLRTRALVQANSGGGKSHAIRAMLEQTHGQVQQIVLDPEGEFGTLREQFGLVLAGKDGDVPAHPKVARVLARRLMEVQASAVIDLYDLTLSERREFVKLFIVELMSLPRTLWRPLLVVLDEAHLFCPERGSGEAQSTEAVISLCTQGRKRGFCAVLATQRISKLHKDAAAELLNKLIGRTGLDVDMRRAGDELGMDKEQRMQLRELQPGNFYAYGPMFGGRIHRVRSAPVLTSHPDSNGIGSAAPAQSASVKALVERIGDLPDIAQREAVTVASLEATLRATQAELRKARSEKGTASPDEIAEAERRGARAAHTDLQARLVMWNQSRHVAVAALGDIVAAATRASDLIRSIDSEESALPSLHVREVPRAVGIIPKAPARKPAPLPEHPGGSLSGPEQRIVDAIAWQESIGIDDPSQVAVAFLAGYTYGAGSFNNPKGSLRAKGLIAYIGGNRIALTDNGRSLARCPLETPTDNELHARVLGRLPGPEQRLLGPLIEAWPEAMSKTALAEAANYTAGAGSFNNPCGRLRTLGLVDYPSAGHVRACDLLFPSSAP